MKPLSLRSLFWFPICLTLPFSLISVANADDSPQFNLGFMGGWGGGGTGLFLADTAHTFGPTAGMRLNDDFGVGASVIFCSYLDTRVGAASIEGGASPRVTDTLAVVGASYFPPIPGRGLELGIQFGVDFYPGAVGTAESLPSSTNFIVGPKFAYDYRFIESLSIGAELDFLFGGQDYSDQLITVKYWF